MGWRVSLKSHIDVGALRNDWNSIYCLSSARVCNLIFLSKFNELRITVSLFSLLSESRYVN